jgi:hypothetical protein
MVLTDLVNGELNVRALSFALNVVQSAEDKAPLFEALAVGTFNVIRGVVVPVATVELRSVPVVPKVKAATLVTVPVLELSSTQAEPL